MIDNLEGECAVYAYSVDVDLVLPTGPYTRHLHTEQVDEMLLWSEVWSADKHCKAVTVEHV